MLAPYPLAARWMNEAQRRYDSVGKLTDKTLKQVVNGVCKLFLRLPHYSEHETCDNILTSSSIVITVYM